MTFAECIREALLEASRAPERPTPGSMASRLGREAERYLDRVVFSNERYMRHPILLWDDWEVMLIAWQSGQITPIHDHRGVMGGMVVLSGTLAEERFTTPLDKPELFDNRVRPEGDLCDIGPDRPAPAAAEERRAPSRSTSTGRRCARWASGTRPG